MIEKHKKEQLNISHNDVETAESGGPYFKVSFEKGFHTYM